MQNDADYMAERFNVVIKELLNELAPVSEFQVRECRSQPWFDEACRTVKRRARRLERRFTTNRNAESKAAGRTSLRSRRRLARKKASSYWKTEIRSAGNSRRIWRHVKTNRGKKRISPWSSTMTSLTRRPQTSVLQLKRR